MTTIFHQSGRLADPQNRARLGLLMAFLYLLWVLMAIPGLGPGFAPDTSGYLESSPYRQPMYGLWANSVHQLLGSWEAVKGAQLALFGSFAAWVVFELAWVSALGVLASLLFTIMLVGLGRLGMLSIVSSLITEGLFFPMLMVMAGLFLAWLRTSSMSALASLALLMVAMTQLRSAALLVVAIPFLIAVFVVFQHSWRSAAGRAGLLVIAILVASLATLPMLLGKRVFQVGTRSDSMGSVLLPRVSLLNPTAEVRNRSPEWVAMSSSWRTAASKLDPVALTQFDAQLQEAIRFDIGPKVLLPALLDRSPAQVQAGWRNGAYFDEARQIALAWIREDWSTYLRLSGFHLWGMLTAANFMGNGDRRQVWEALQSVSPLTWRVAAFRTDYPLNRINEPLKQRTAMLYFLIRYGSIAALAMGLACFLRLLRQASSNRKLHPGGMAIAASVIWCLAHSVPAALTVFPELRYTYANILVMFAGAAAWLAYLREPTSWDSG